MSDSTKNVDKTRGLSRGAKIALIICASAALLIAIGSLYFFTTRLVIDGQVFRKDSKYVDLKDADINDVSKLAKFTEAETIDLRGSKISSADYDYLTGVLPGCEILWMLDIGGKLIDPSAEEIDLSGVPIEDISVLKYLTNVKKLDMTGCGVPDKKMLKVKEMLPDCKVLWNITVFEKEFPCDTADIDLTDICFSYASGLEDKLVYFDDVRSVRVEDTALSDRDMQAIADRHPEIELTWPVTLYDVPYLNSDTVLYLGEQDDGYKQLIYNYKYFYNKPTIDLSGVLLDADTLAKIYEISPDIFVLCNVSLGGTEFPTDVKDLTSVLGVDDYGHAGIEDISVLRYCKYLEYAIIFSHVTDYSPLLDCPDLRYLYVYTNDLSQVAEFTQLVSLNVSSASIVDRQIDLSPLAALTNLEQICILNATVDDLTPLTNLKKLTTLSFASTHVSDYSALAEMTSLRWLDVGITMENIRIIPGFDTIGTLVNLEQLTIRGHIDDLSILSDLHQLQSLSLMATDIEDFSILRNFPHLHRLTFNYAIFDNSDLNYIKELKELEYFELHPNSLTEEQEAELREALPNCEFALF